MRQCLVARSVHAMLGDHKMDTGPARTAFVRSASDAPASSTSSTSPSVPVRASTPSAPSASSSLASAASPGDDWSMADLQLLRVVDLQAELRRRDLNAVGRKTELVQRLFGALHTGS
jgi:hypothetical protein